MKTAQVGDLATLCYPQDLYPYIVTKVSPGGRKVTLSAIGHAGIAPAALHNGFPFFDHSFSTDEARHLVQPDSTLVAYLGANGYSVDGFTPIALGVARYRRDWSD